MVFRSDFLNVLEERGFLHQISDAEGLDQKLCEGVQSAYIGFDPTAPSLHIGNLTGIMMLYWFQTCGHKPITLMGGATSKIGDPSFKDEQRVLMDESVIKANIEAVQAHCFTQFLSYSEAENGALMVNNDTWLSTLKYLDFLRDYGRYFTVNRMLSFDSVRQRLERESPLSLLEFNYMVMQGYDFLELYRRYGTILQMGGSDQWGNIINGVDLGHKADRVNLFALTAPLLTTPDGKKMGKTEKGAVWLSAQLLSAYDYYQYWRNVDDAMVGILLRRFTLLPMDEIIKLEALQGQEINEAKKILAFEATALCRGREAAEEAQATATQVFTQGGSGIGQDLPVLEVDSDTGISLLSALVDSGLVATRSEARRVLEQGGVRMNGVVMSDPDLCLMPSHAESEGYIRLSSGKKKHALIRFKGSV